MHSNTRISRLGGMIEAEVDGDLVGLDIEQGSCFGFNSTATRIWRLIDTAPTFGALCDALMDEHDVDLEICREETAVVLNKMVAEKLVTLTPP